MEKKGQNNRGPRVQEVKEFDEEVIQIDRVVRVVKGGRRLRFRATVAIGDRMGRVGVGIGKSVEVTGAIQKAISKAKKTLVKVPIYNGTIPHELKYKFKSSKLLILPASPGTGIIAGGAVRKIAALAGIKNLLSKSLGSSNKVNMAQTTIKAFGELDELTWKKPDVLKREVKKVVQDPRDRTDQKPGGKQSHRGGGRPTPKTEEKAENSEEIKAKPETEAPIEASQTVEQVENPEVTESTTDSEKAE